MKPAEAPLRRPYRSPRRREQAAQTRAAVLSAASHLFASRGWATTGMRDVAREAQVAVETVYAYYHSKPELLVAAIDAAVVGDVEPVSLADRPEFARLSTGSFDDRVQAAAHLVTQIHVRTAGLHLALRQGAAGEPSLARALVDGENRRRRNVEQAAGLMLGHPIDPVVRDSLWAVLSVDVFRLLTDLTGWSVDQYEEWVTAEIAHRLRTAAID